MKIQSKKIRNFLIILLIAQTLNLGIFEGLKITSEKLGTFIYSITAQPFLAQSLQNTTHQLSENTFVGGSGKIATQH